MKFTSLCVLSFNRPEMTMQSLNSLIANTTSPYELIVNDDGSKVVDHLIELYRQGKISKLVLQNGENRGIKHASHQAFRMAEGDMVYKLDTDIIYMPNWLETLNDIYYVDDSIGAVGAFNYNHYDPKDNRFNIIETDEMCHFVDDFVPSVIGMYKDSYEVFCNEFEADGWQLEIKKKGYKLAIPKIDVVKNIGFGVGPSTFVIEKDGKIQTTPFCNYPHLNGLDTSLTKL